MAINGSPNPKHYNMSELKSRLLGDGLAQNSVYIVNVNSPSGGSFSNFLQRRGITSIDKDRINLLCCDASLPGTSLATHEATNDHSGVTEKMAYRRIYDDSIDLTFYVDNTYKVISYFDAWMDYVTGVGTVDTTDNYQSNTAFYRMNYPKYYKTNIFLTKFEKNNRNSSQPTLKYVFIDTFPTNIISIPVSYESSDILKCTVSFSYIRYVRDAASSSNSSYTPPSTPSEQAATNSPGTPEFNMIDRALSPSGSGTSGFSDPALDARANAALNPTQ